MAQVVLKKGDKLRPRAVALTDLDIIDAKPGRVLLNFKDDKGKDCGGGWFNIDDVLQFYEVVPKKK